MDLEPEELLRRRKATWDKYRLILSAFFNFCVDNSIIELNPIAGKKEFKVKYNRPVPRWFSPEELKTLFNYFDTKDNLIISCFYRFLPYSGLRVSEAINLKWINVNLKSKIIIVTGSTKSHQNRNVPLNNTIYEYLIKLKKMHPGNLVFNNGNGEKYKTYDAWYKMLQTALKNCDIPPGGLHGFRHAFGSGLGRIDTHPKKIQELMGHSSIETAMIYCNFFPSDLIAPVNNLPF